MTTTDIAKLRELLDNATPGEWEARQVPGTMPAAVCSFGVISHAIGKETSRMWTADDARLIAAAHNALPSLLDEIERLTRELAGERDLRSRTINALRMKEAALEALMGVCTRKQIERANGGPLS